MVVVVLMQVDKISCKSLMSPSHSPVDVPAGLTSLVVVIVMRYPWGKNLSAPAAVKMQVKSSRQKLQHCLPDDALSGIRYAVSGFVMNKNGGAQYVCTGEKVIWIGL